ncbi:MAG: RidA family protein [Bacteroidetes bacterium]|nr:RidA family protein [Bacteroidota bacterium]
MKKKIIQTKNAPAAIGPYSQAIKVGNALFISGQIPIDPETDTMVIGGIEPSTHRVMKNIGAILEAAGCNYNHIVKATIFIKNMDDFTKINKVYSSYFLSDYPARETVEVARLPKDAEVEISVIATVP